MSMPSSRCSSTPASSGRSGPGEHRPGQRASPAGDPDALAFTYSNANDLWTSDLMHGPRLLVSGRGAECAPNEGGLRGGHVAAGALPGRQRLKGGASPSRDGLLDYDCRECGARCCESGNIEVTEDETKRPSTEAGRI
jgi:hypothetical protein